MSFQPFLAWLLPSLIVGIIAALAPRTGGERSVLRRLGLGVVAGVAASPASGQRARTAMTATPITDRTQRRLSRV